MVVRQGTVLHKKDMELWPLKMAAKEIGISYQSLYLAIERHRSLKDCIEIHENRRFVRMPDVKHAYNKIAKRNQPRKSSSSGEADGDSFHEANLRQKELKSELLYLELQEKAGKFIPLELAETTWRNIAAITMKAVMSIPDRVSPLLVEQKEQSFIHTTLTTELKAALQNLHWRDSAKVAKKK